jgi:propionate CoA-transferase
VTSAGDDLEGSIDLMQIIDAAAAAALVRSGDTVTVSGLVGNLVPERILEALERRFVETGQPEGLTEIHPWLYGGPDGTGLNRFAHPGFLKRIIGSTYILPALNKAAPINRLILDDGVEGYCWPANAIFQMLRAGGAGRAGHATTIGLDTFADPRVDGGRLNASAKEDLIEVITLAGEDHLFYPTIPIDVALVKASTADTDGNLFCEDEGLTQGILLQATAAKRAGGTVVAQVRRVVEAGSMHPLMVEVPGALVDHVVVHESGRQWDYGPTEGDNPASTGTYRVVPPPIPAVPQSPAKIIGRRALMDVARGELVNAGGGVPISHLLPVAYEEGVASALRWSIEHGVFGGQPISATHWNPHAITSPGWLLDFYNGGGLDRSFLAMGEVDREGNVNVGRLGDQLPGPGGFTDIAAGTERVTFCGTMTTGGLEVEAVDGTLRIVREGSRTKFVDSCQMVCFSGRQAAARGQSITYVTERAVFRLEGGRVVLTEVAPGIDVQRQVLDLAEFPIAVSPNLALMDVRLFQDAPMGLTLRG